MNFDIANSIYSSDTDFDSQYPIYVRELSELHWTPLKVIKVAARFLGSDKNARVLDIGSGVGKFCIAGTHYAAGHFTGIEQRKNFVRVSNKVAQEAGAVRAEFIHGNFLDMDIAGYTGIYFFNSFHENIVLTDSLDEKIERTPELYQIYTAHLIKQLKAMPVGTRLATYWLSIPEIPGCYRLQATQFDGLMKLWVKDY
jgi:SAM-dependent methyltransferase